MAQHAAEDEAPQVHDGIDCGQDVASSPAVAFDPLQTLTSGQRKELHGGAMQAHLCVVASESDVNTVMQAFRESRPYSSVANWSFAYRIAGSAVISEGSDDGVDEGCGGKLLATLERFALHEVLLVVSRWQDYGVTPGLELFGTQLYSIVVERAKDLIKHVQTAMGLGADRALKVQAAPKPPPGPRNYDYTSLPALPEPRVPMKFAPNHFLADGPKQRPASLPNIFGGGDVRQWMENDRSLRQLPEADLRTLKSIRAPDPKVERVLEAVSVLRGHGSHAGGSAAQRWSLYTQVLKSQTFRTEMLLTDASQVPIEAAERAQHLLAGLDPEALRRASSGARALYDWATGIVQWRLCGPPGEEADREVEQIACRSVVR